MHEGAGQRQAAPFAWRERAHVTPATLVEADYLQQRVDGNLAYLLAQAAGASDELEVLLGGEPVVQHRLLGDIADAVAHGSGAAHGVVAVDSHPTGGRPIEACQ